MVSVATKQLPGQHISGLKLLRYFRYSLLALALLNTASAHGELRQDCLAWARSSGPQQHELANRIGTELLLTKNHRLEGLDPDHPQSLYRYQDIQRVCRGN